MSRKSVNLICSAIQDEIEYLPNSALQDRGFLLRPLGIGFLDAALNLDHLFHDPQYKIEKVIFLGTCGSYDLQLEIGELVTVSTTALVNLGNLQNFSYLPSNQEKYNLREITNFKSAICLSSLEISASEKISDLVQQLKIANEYIVENMELYGLAKVCKEYQVPLSALLGVTNYINVNAHYDWLTNNKVISKKLCEALCSQQILQI